MKFWKFNAWIITNIVMVALLDLGFGLLSAADTVFNILGVVLLTSVIYLIITTKFFINLLKKSKNNEK